MGRPPDAMPRIAASTKNPHLRFLAELAHKHHLSQEALADRLGICSSSVQRFFEREAPRSKNLERYALALNLKPIVARAFAGTLTPQDIRSAQKRIVAVIAQEKNLDRNSMNEALENLRKKAPNAQMRDARTYILGCDAECERFLGDSGHFPDPVRVAEKILPFFQGTPQRQNSQMFELICALRDCGVSEHILVDIAKRALQEAHEKGGLKKDQFHCLIQSLETDPMTMLVAGLLPPNEADILGEPLRKFT